MGLEEKLRDFLNSETEARPDGKAAMRAYLQRCEVRLSTLQRIATAFVSGAALMVLVPIFAKDIIIELGAKLLVIIRDGLIYRANVDIVIALLCVAIVAFLALIPLRALYLLFRDVLDFYFTVDTPSFPSASTNMQNPTLALTSVAFSKDEDDAEEIRSKITAYQYQRTGIDFMLPFSSARSPKTNKNVREVYFGSFPKDIEEVIIPTERIVQKDALGKRIGETIEYASKKYTDIRYFDIAMGIARSNSRTLAEEVALTEMALVRHILFLRRLIFRYVKTILLFLWVTFALLITLAVWKIIPVLPTVALGCFVCVIPIKHILHGPIRWIHLPLKKNGIQPNPEANDPQLKRLENEIAPIWTLFVFISFVTFLIAAIQTWIQFV